MGTSGAGGSSSWNGDRVAGEGGTASKAAEGTPSVTGIVILILCLFNCLTCVLDFLYAATIYFGCDKLSSLSCLGSCDFLRLFPGLRERA